MKYYIFFCIVIILFIPVCVDAASCTKEQLARYEQLANQIQTTLEYHETEDGITFDIIFHNVHEDFYLLESYNNDYSVRYDKNTNGMIIAENYKLDSNTKFKVMNNNKLCNVTTIKTINVLLPNYNKYYKDPVCVGLIDFELCKKWVNIGNLSYDNFLKSVNDYKDSLSLKENENFEPIDDNWINDVRNFFSEYYAYIILGVIIVAIIIVIVKNSKIRY